MKRLLLTAVLATAHLVLYSQVPSLEWVKQLGSTKEDMGASVCLDTAGNVYHTGCFSGTLDFDPGPGVYNMTAESYDAYILKLDAAGNFQWAKKLDGVGMELPSKMHIDKAGNIYLTGDFNSTVDFDPGPGVYKIACDGSIDAFIVKLDKSGGFLWAGSIGGPNFQQGMDVTSDMAGNVYVTGEFDTGTVDFDPGPGVFNLTAKGRSMFILKLDVSGKLVWAKSMEGTASTQSKGNSITTDAAGNIYTAGRFLGTVDFDPGPAVASLTTSGSGDIFISKLNAAGNYVWAKSIGGPDLDEAWDIFIDDADRLFVATTFRNTVDFDPGLGTYLLSTTGSYTEIGILKLDKNGTFIWARSMGGTENDHAQSVVADGAGFIYITGHFYGTADFDPGPGVFNLISKGYADIFVAKLDTAGSFVTAVSFGGARQDYGCQVATGGKPGYIYTCGAFEQTVDFDPASTIFNLTSVGAFDIFLHKMLICTIDAAVNVTGSLLTSVNKGTSYQWVTCPGYASIAGATRNSYIATKTGNYALIISQDDCIDTSDCIPVTATSIDDPILYNTVNITPNPTESSIRILTGLTFPDVSVKILDMLGGVALSEKHMSGDSFYIDVSSLTSGVYFVRVYTPEKVICVQKIVKQ